MTHPVPPYLIALAVGDIAFRRSGRARRSTPSHRWSIAPPSEFVDLEKMVEAAEALYGPLSLGPLRRAGAAAVVPIRRHGEPDA